MRIGVLRSIASSPNSAKPKHLAVFRPSGPSGTAFARRASTVPISCQRRADAVLISSKANHLRWAARRQLSSATPEDATIYALSTAPGTAAIAVIRISGAACMDVQHKS